MVSFFKITYTDAYASFRQGGLPLHLFLFIIAIGLLVLTVASFKQMIAIGARTLFAELDGRGESNGVRQTVYALTGMFLLFVLVVMKDVPLLFWPGIVVSADSLLFLFACNVNRDREQEGPIRRYYSSGFGLYLSALIQIVFLVAAIVLFLL
jgi:hypothetical protein